jgi:NTP pyrophosphatase (non-canonical NTP hydrolase)|tara:strand:- start:6 stop:239 length:234 start_codon:yes stop_codon:yes gene_type:complete
MIVDKQLETSLTHLIEEIGEVTQVCAKILRHDLIDNDANKQDTLDRIILLEKKMQNVNDQMEKSKLYLRYLQLTLVR